MLRDLSFAVFKTLTLYQHETPLQNGTTREFKLLDALVHLHYGHSKLSSFNRP
jgi:hypothetical protein